MNDYLLVVLFSLKEKKESDQKKIEETIKKLGGKILYSENRLEQLVYKIKKQDQANLLKVFFSLEADSLAEFKKILNQKIENLRYLLVKFPYTKIEKSKKELKKKKAKKETKKKTIKKPLKKAKKTEKLDKALEKILKE